MAPSMIPASPSTTAFVPPRACGAFPLSPAGGCAAYWAPLVERLEVLINGQPHGLQRTAEGWHRGDILGLSAGARYQLRLEGKRVIPDPFSRRQPLGVHGASEVVDLDSFPWSDRGWRGLPLADLVIYELHIGTFTEAGTCDAAIARLDELVELGITAIEIMPVAQCPGSRNWGYDGVYPFAVQDSFGGAAALQRLVDACHARGLAVVLDVVYNHFGPEGCYIGDLLPISTDRYSTPWGAAINVDGPQSDGVRELLLANAWQWFAQFHVDALRLDAIHEIHDESAAPFLAVLAACARTWSEHLGRQLHLIAESDLNASRIVRSPEVGGYGLSAQWMDDFHHALHVAVTGERKGFLADFGSVAQLRRAFDRGFVYDGIWSEARGRTYGDTVRDLPTERFVVCCQNHDQIGNRMLGERLPALTDAAGLRCCAAAVLLSPYLPLLFMGEEYGETKPFLYFVDHGDPQLIEAVRQGRRREFAALHGDGQAPDPVDPATRDASRVDPSAASRPPGSLLRAFHRTCLGLRRSLPSLRPGPRQRITVGGPHPSVVEVDRVAGACRTLLLLNPTGEQATGTPLPPGRWTVLLHSEDARWGGGSPPLAESASGSIDLPARSAVLLGWAS